MSKIRTEREDMGDLICGLKGIVAALECQQKREKEGKQMMAGNKIPTFPPMYMMIPIEEDSSCNIKKSKNKFKKKCNVKSISSCDSNVKESNTNKTKVKKLTKEQETECVYVSPEMRAGVLYSKCDCLLRNGLQDDCPLSLCQGQPDCLIKPWAECPPGKYYRARHPDIYPAPTNPNTSCSL